MYLLYDRSFIGVLWRLVGGREADGYWKSATQPWWEAQRVGVREGGVGYGQLSKITSGNTSPVSRDFEMDLGLHRTPPHPPSDIKHIQGL